jgi:hypothetical protein
MLDPYPTEQQVSNAVRNFRAERIQAVADEGMQRSLFLAEDWVIDAEAEIARLAQGDTHFSADDIVSECGPAPSAGAVGAVFRRASRAGVIEPIGVTTSRRLSRHGGLQRIWRGLHA